MAESAELVHATCVAIGGTGVLIRGPSGAGKSDLALRLLYTPLPDRFGIARLVGDDQVRLTVDGDTLVAHTAPHLADKMEVRGTGIVAQETRQSVPVHLVIDATPKNQITRLPDESDCWTQLLSVHVRRQALSLLEPSAVARILCVLDLIGRDELFGKPQV